MGKILKSIAQAVDEALPGLKEALTPRDSEALRFGKEPSVTRQGKPPAGMEKKSPPEAKKTTKETTKTPAEPPAEPPGVTPGVESRDDLTDWKAAIDAHSIPEEKPSHGYNLERFSDRDEFKAMLDEVGQTNEALGLARNDPKSFDRIWKDAQKELSEELFTQVPKDWTPRQIVGARALVHTMADNLYRMSEEFTQPGREVSTEELARFSKEYARFQSFSLRSADATTELARALAVHRDRAAPGTPQRLAELKRIVAVNGGKTNVKTAMRRIAATGGKPGDVAGAAQVPMVQKAGQMVREWWRSALVSGLPTHVAGAVSNTAVQAYETFAVRPLAAVYGKILPRPEGSDFVSVTEVLADTASLYHGVIDGFRIMAKQWKHPDEFTDPNFRAEGTAYRGWNFSDDTTIGRASNVIGQYYVNMPFRLLETVDQLHKTMAFSREMAALAIRQAKQEGLTGAEYQERVYRLSQGEDERLVQEAVRRSEEQTFTENVTNSGSQIGDISNMIQGLANRSTAAALIFPFVRTPHNLMAYSARNNVIAPISKRWMDDMKAGGARRDMAMARWTAGTAMTAATIVAVQDRKITGAGPKDPRVRAMLGKTGWKPYSIYMNGEYVPYNRLDPFGMLIGTYANAMETLEYAGASEDDADAISLSIAVMTGFTGSTLSKTYMKGFADLMKIISEAPGDYSVALAQNYAASLTGAFTVPSWLKNVAEGIDVDPDNPDHIMKRDAGYAEGTGSAERVIATLTKRIQSRIPLARDGLAPYVDAWGDPSYEDDTFWSRTLVPFRVSSPRKQYMATAVYHLGLRIPKPQPITNISGRNTPVDLRELDRHEGKVYAQYQQFIGNARYSSLQTAIQPGEDLTAMIQDEARMDFARKMLRKGTRLGKLDFSSWYSEEAKKHPEWVQPDSPEMLQLIEKTRNLDEELQPLLPHLDHIQDIDSYPMTPPSDKQIVPDLPTDIGVRI